MKAIKCRRCAVEAVEIAGPKVYRKNREHSADGYRENMKNIERFLVKHWPLVGDAVVTNSTGIALCLRHWLEDPEWDIQQDKWRFWEGATK